MSGLNSTQIHINSQIKRTAKDSLIYLPTKVIPAIIGIILIRILTTYFSPEEYGHYQIALSTFGLIRVLSTIWLSTSVTRFFLKYKNEGQKSSFYSSLSLCAFLSVFIISIVGFFINDFYLKQNIAQPLFELINLVIAASIFNSFFEILVMVYRAGLEPKKYSLYWILFSIGKPFIGVVLIILAGFKGEGIFWGFLVTPLILDILIFKKLELHKFIRPSLVSKNLLKQFTSYGIPITFSFLSFWVLSLSDRYLIDIFRNSAEVGLYSVGYTISEKTLNFIYMILMLAAYPIIIDNWEKYGEEKTQGLITELTRYFFLICMPILIIIIVIPKQILLIFSSDKFVAGSKVLPYIAVGVFTYGLTQYVIKGFELHKKSIKIALLALMAGIINIGLNIILIPRYGFLGAGIAACSAYIAYFLASYYFVKFDMAWIPPYKSILKIGIAAFHAGMFIKLLMQLSQNIFYVIILFVPLSLVIYLAMLIFLHEIKQNEIKKALIFIQKIFKG
ncbi:oligosaccharide flippase family protein [candidate division KSB1 bacterium]|nr:oligosaccharide flippase family protein [candidate division KSB1 bacterium]